MVDRNDSLFKEFLASYESGHKLLADMNDSSISDADINAEIAAQSGLVRKFEKWASLPRSVINEYNGHVPDWVLDVAENKNVDELRLLDKDPRMTQDELEAKMREQYAEERDAWLKGSGVVITAAMVAAMAQPIMDAGYSEKTANALGYERSFRNELAKIMEQRPLNDKELKLWRESRRETFRIIRDDWIKEHPERHLIHLLSKHNRALRRGDEISDEKLNGLVQELANTLQNMQTNGRLEHFDEYLDRLPIRLKVKHFRPETMELLELAAKQMHGQTEHKTNAPKTEQLENVNISRDLPTDVVDVLKKMQIIQNNRHQNAEGSIDKSSAYQNISPLAREMVRERSRT